MCNYDYNNLNCLRIRYSVVKTHDEERIIANELFAFLSAPDKYEFELGIGESDIGYYGDLLSYHPEVRRRVGYLDGLLLKIEKPLDMYSDEDLRLEFFKLFKSKQIEILKKQNTNETINNLSFVANQFDIRHAKTEDSLKEFDKAVQNDVQRTVISEGIKIMKTDSYQNENIVFNSVCSEIRSILKGRGFPFKTTQ